MSNSTIAVKTIKGEAILYLIGIAVIYLVPTLSHAFAIPLYYLEPMRLILIFSLLYARKRDAFILALTLPLISFLISGHPLFYKVILITGELSINVAFFYTLRKFNTPFYASVLFSIVIAKLLYYSFKYIFITSGLLAGTLISTPLIIQLIIVVLLTGYTYFAFKNNTTKKLNYDK